MGNSRPGESVVRLETVGTLGPGATMRTSHFTSESWLPVPRELLFPFFADAGNLERITPPWLHFRILTRLPIAMAVDTRIEYRLRLWGFPLGWRTRITAWQPPERFVDEQEHGPYRLWVHEHTFVPRGGGTLCLDRVTYAAPGGVLADRWLVGPQVRRIFAYRRRELQRLFPAGRTSSPATPLERT